MFDSFGNVFRSFAGFTAALTIAVPVVLGMLVVIRRLRGRRRILFDPWIDLRPQPGRHREELCGQMIDRACGLRAYKRPVDGFAPDAASYPTCSHPGLWERRAK